MSSFSRLVAARMWEAATFIVTAFVLFKEGFFESFRDRLDWDDAERELGKKTGRPGDMWKERLLKEFRNFIKTCFESYLPFLSFGIYLCTLIIMAATAICDVLPQDDPQIPIFQYWMISISVISQLIIPLFASFAVFVSRSELMAILSLMQTTPDELARRLD